MRTLVEQPSFQTSLSSLGSHASLDPEPRKETRSFVPKTTATHISDKDLLEALQVRNPLSVPPDLAKEQKSERRDFLRHVKELVGEATEKREAEVAKKSKLRALHPDRLVDNEEDEQEAGSAWHADDAGGSIALGRRGMFAAADKRRSQMRKEKEGREEEEAARARVSRGIVQHGKAEPGLNAPGNAKLRLSKEPWHVQHRAKLNGLLQTKVSQRQWGEAVAVVAAMRTDPFFVPTLTTFLHVLHECASPQYASAQRRGHRSLGRKEGGEGQTDEEPPAWTSAARRRIDMHDSPSALAVAIVEWAADTGIGRQATVYEKAFVSCTRNKGLRSEVVRAYRALGRAGVEASESIHEQIVEVR